MIIDYVLNVELLVISLSICLNIPSSTLVLEKSLNVHFYRKGKSKTVVRDVLICVSLYNEYIIFRIVGNILLNRIIFLFEDGVIFLCNAKHETRF